MYPVVEREYQKREEGYAALGGYLDGDNATGTKFNFTQPVVMSYPKEGNKTMQMFVGSVRATGEVLPPSALPLPTDSTVRLTVAGGEVVAVMKFEGYITPETAGSARRQLEEALQQDGVALAEQEAAGLFRVAQYGPVYSLSPRLNEMMLKIRL